MKEDLIRGKTITPCEMALSTFSRRFICTAGLILSLYALYVEYKVEHKSEDDEEEFVSLCDIKSFGASCR